MKISWPKASKYTLAQQRKWKKLAEYCNSHYPKDHDLHRAVKESFGAFQDWGRKQAGTTRTTKRTLTTMRRSSGKRTTRRAAPSGRTTRRRVA